MGKEYLDAWYLHHHLDVVHKNRYSNKSLEEILQLHQSEHPETYSAQVAEYLREYKRDLTI